jgi:PLP dependent protein
MIRSHESDTISSRIAAIREQIPASVRLIAVTKQVSVDAMREAYAAGVRDFGESRVQEAAAKQSQLLDLPDITWHLIGHLQSNKVKKALELFEWIHSIDSLKLAQQCDAIANQMSLCPQVCLQVKLLPDPNKYGFSLPELLEALPELDRCQHLQIRGLMTIPPLDLNQAEIGTLFERTRQLAQEIQQQHWSRIQIQHLSMGMSDDYPQAIAQGATMIRLGSILFGARPTQT